MVIFIFYFLDWTYPFWVNLAQKFKIVSLSSNLAPTLFRKYKIRWRCSFFLFQTFFLLALSKKCIWRFVINSQQFNRRGLKPVVSSCFFRSQQFFCQELLPRFGFPGYQPWSAIIKFSLKL